MYEDDTLLNELKQAWEKLNNSLVSPCPNEGPAMVENPIIPTINPPKEEPEAEQIADNLRSQGGSKNLRLGDFM